MVRLRLQRFGAKREPYYRIVAADQRKARNGRFIEQLGTYDPKEEPPEIRIDGERAEYWIDNGAQPTDTVLSFIKSLREEASNVTDLSEEGADEARREERRRQRREEIEQRRQELADATSEDDESAEEDEEAEASDDASAEAEDEADTSEAETADEPETSEASEEGADDESAEEAEASEEADDADEESDDENA